jgi:hypothetical protein
LTLEAAGHNPLEAQRMENELTEMWFYRWLEARKAKIKADKKLSARKSRQKKR